MKKETTSILLSCISLLISVIATCIATYRTPALSFDYQGVLVGALSVLVTALIGWNIYALIDFSSKERQINATIEKITYEASTQMGYAVRAYVVYLSAMDSYSKGEMDIALNGYFIAINEGLKGNDNTPLTLSLSSLEDIASYFAKHGKCVKIEHGDREKHISTLYQLYKDERFGNVDFEKLFKMIEMAEIKGEI